MTTVLIIIAALVALLIYTGVEKLREIRYTNLDIPDYGTVSVTIDVDTSGFVDGMQRVARSSQRLSASFRAMGRGLTVVRAGVEARWWTRGALYASLGWPDDCVAEEVQRALTEELLFPTQAAAAFMRGWAENRVYPDDVLLEHARALPLDPHPMYDRLVEL